MTQGELYSAIKKEKEQTEAGDASTTHFSGEMHFYELVEDTKDGIWLVQVKALHYGAINCTVGVKGLGGHDTTEEIHHLYLNLSSFNFFYLTFHYAVLILTILFVKEDLSCTSPQYLKVYLFT